MTQARLKFFPILRRNSIAMDGQKIAGAAELKLLLSSSNISGGRSNRRSFRTENVGLERCSKSGFIQSSMLVLVRLFSYTVRLH